MNLPTYSYSSFCSCSRCPTCNCTHQWFCCPLGYQQKNQVQTG